VSRRDATSVHAIWRNEAGAVAVIAALGLTALIGIVGLAVDVGMWYRANRALQNAADAAAIAASQNGTGSYQSEARAVAAQYGFVHDTAGITVTAWNNQTCPDGETDCYKVTVAQASAPLFFSAVLGISAPALSGAAMASGVGTQINCLLALAGLPGHSSKDGIRGDGTGHANMAGCRVMSDSNARCTGQGLGASYGDAHGTSSGCGQTNTPNVPQVADPYSSLSSHIPANPCGSYYVEPTHHNDPPLNPINIWGPGGNSTPSTLTDTPTTANHGIVCGDLQLTTDVTLTTASPDSLLVIENGNLDTNGHMLKTAPGSALTIIFSGTAGSYNHGIIDSSNSTSGKLDFMAPTSGTWSGIAIYQDPNLTTGVDISYTGNKPTWDITGVAYLPHSSVQFSGAVSKSSNGANCFLMVADNILINGTANIAEIGECPLAGVTLPTESVGTIALVK
jgi:Flp pilus assembly protein TadG